MLAMARQADSSVRAKFDRRSAVVSGSAPARSAAWRISGKIVS